MCIIIAKRKNDRLPTETELKECFKRNSDGSGFMYVENNKVRIEKGFMKEQDFLDKFKELCGRFNNFKNKSLVIHCRIGTSSGNTPQNTHPYPITYKESELHKLDFTTDLGMVHNGIISEYTPTWNNPTTNDTQEFILKYVYGLYANYKDFYKNKYIRNGLKKITNSKLVFLDTTDTLYFVGDFVEENGLSFSNTSYKPYVYTNYNYTYSKNYAPSTTRKAFEDLDYLEDYDIVLKNVKLDSEDLKSMVKLSNDMNIYVYERDNSRFEKVGNRTLYFDKNLGDVYELKTNGLYDLIYENTYIYDSKYNWLF